MKILRETCYKNNIICDINEVFKYMRTLEEDKTNVQLKFDI